MIRTLLGKEIREHWLALGALLLFSLLGLLIVTLAALAAGQAGNALEPLRGFIITFGTLAALIICSRLVVREYTGKTQLFLESLPLTRARMLAIKYALGFAVMFMLAALAFTALLPVVARHEPLTTLFVEIVGARMFAFVFFVYSFFFVTGMLGRYRIAIYFGIALGFAVLSTTTQLEITRFGPFAVVDNRFAFEREHFPVEALLTTLALGVAFTGMAFVLAQVREGSVAAMLAEKMSHREKVFITAIFVGIVFIGSTFDRQKQKEPFNLPDAIVENSDGVTVKVSVGPQQDRLAGQLLAAQVHAELASAVDYLGLAYSPTVFITTRRDLDANRYERGELVNGEGLLTRVNFSAPGFDKDRFLMWLMREFLIEATKGRATLESKMWVLDGFAPFWLRRQRANAGLVDDRRMALRAVYGTVDDTRLRATGLNEADLRDWRSFRERVGDGIADGVAWSGLDVLARLYGRERSRAFLRAVLGSHAPNDVRALFFEWRHPIVSLFEQNTGVRMAQFVSKWREELEAARLALTDDLERLPRVHGDVSFEALSADTRIVRYRVAVDPPPGVPDPASRITLLHANLTGADIEVGPNHLMREDIAVTPEASGQLDGTWTRGSRFYSTFSLEVADLGCEVISGWTRREIR
jgi:hypothetical protein